MKVMMLMNECQTQTDRDMSEYTLYKEGAGAHPPTADTSKPIMQEAKAEICDTDITNSDDTSSHNPCYPERERRAPKYLQDYECKVKCDDDQELTSIDYCCRVISDVPQNHEGGNEFIKFRFVG